MKKSVKEQFLTDFFACLLFFKLFFRRGEEIVPAPEMVWSGPYNLRPVFFGVAVVESRRFDAGVFCRHDAGEGIFHGMFSFFSR